MTNDLSEAQASTLKYADDSYLIPLKHGPTERTLKVLERKGYLTRAQGTHRYFLTDKGADAHATLSPGCDTKENQNV